jgi:dolichol-phosphate mannosyltransferase
MPRFPQKQIELSIVVPAHNEEDNVRPLVAEITAAVEPLGIAYEMVFIDDCSTDGTGRRLMELLSEFLRLRVIRLQCAVPGRGNGQSAAFHAGFRAARGAIIATLDADLQNDPADIPHLLDVMRRESADMVQGNRMAVAFGGRRDNLARRCSSRVGRFFRHLLLGDTIIDTGCSLRIIRRDVALALPLEFRGMHRFIPVTARHLGFGVIEVPVNHRPRTRGVAKYGIWNRAIPGLIDCFAVRWMRNRRRPVAYHEMTSQQANESARHHPSPSRA